jgi:hypothetical protein
MRDEEDPEQDELDAKRNKDNIFRNIEQHQIVKGFRDRDFDAKEKQDLENLRMAVEFIKE